MMEFKYIQNADVLPQAWDELADNYFQQKAFLSHTEIYNPCHQRYYLGFDGGRLVSGAIMYSLRLDIFTFLRLKSPIKMNIVGIPCSVSCPGIFGNHDAVNALKEHIYKREKGFVLFLNLENPVSDVYASGNTLPTIVLKNNFTDWDNYLSLLRSHYRRRIKLINKPHENIRIEKMSCAAFNDEMYRQYLEVYNRSKDKLEKLSMAFFKALPPYFMMTVCYAANNVIGWNITLSDKNTYYFFLGGIDYKMNKIHHTYFRLLTAIIKDGIDKEHAVIDLGQTAEIPKMRLGGKPMLRYMEANHSNLIFNKLLKLSKGLLEYKKTLETPHSIKEEMV